jgi:hypothetical protein
MEQYMAGMRRGITAALLLATVLAVGGCDGVLGPRSDDTLRELLESRQRIWQEKGPAAYTMTVTRVAGDTESLREAVLYVSGGTIQSAFWADTEEPLSATERANYHTVEGMFALIRDALDRRVPGITAAYDAEYGYPREIRVDYDSRRTDDDLYFGVTGFAPAD